MKVFDRSLLFNKADDFFLHRGSAVMKLTPRAAQDVCEKAGQYGLLIVRIEGGIWHNPGFEARLDCIWDGLDPPVTDAALSVNNQNASDFIALENENHNAFIVTAA